MKLNKIVITGGPCAGKTTAMSWVQNAFTKLGYRVLFVPETATELITGGVAPWTCGTNLDYQKVPDGAAAGEGAALRAGRPDHGRGKGPHRLRPGGHGQQGLHDRRGVCRGAAGDGHQRGGAAFELRRRVPPGHRRQGRGGVLHLRQQRRPLRDRGAGRGPGRPAHRGLEEPSPSLCHRQLRGAAGEAEKADRPDPGVSGRTRPSRSSGNS